MWYLWNGAKSPVFGKDKNRSFEHYFIEDPEVMRETMNPYYQLSEEEETCDMILKEFGLPTKGSHIINGHMPVKIKSGETPIRAGGKLFIIDGGLSKAYQERTGIAGYTLISIRTISRLRNTSHLTRSASGRRRYILWRKCRSASQWRIPMRARSWRAASRI